MQSTYDKSAQCNVSVCSFCFYSAISWSLNQFGTENKLYTKEIV
jgi:hypothetical protein